MQAKNEKASPELVDSTNVILSAPNPKLHSWVKQIFMNIAICEVDFSSLGPSELGTLFIPKVEIMTA